MAVHDLITPVIPLKCAGRVHRAWTLVRADLECMLRGQDRARLLRFIAEQTGDADPDATEDDLRQAASECFHQYGLSFDYVAPGTFTDQRTGYWRYQISTGGPGEEIRFYGSHADQIPARAEFWFLDWFDGASIDVTDSVAADVWDWFRDVGSVRAEFDRAMSCEAEGGRP